MHAVRLVSALAAAVVMLGVCSSARADGDTGGALLNIEPADTDPLLVGAVQAADAYWTRMGLAPPCPAVLYLYDDTYEDAQAAADAGGCRIWITRRARRSAELGFLVQFCGTMTHERGHNIIGDPDHTSGWPIMRHDTDGTRPIPTECYTWAKSLKQSAPRIARRRAEARRPANWSRTRAGRVRTR